MPVPRKQRLGRTGEKHLKKLQTVEKPTLEEQASDPLWARAHQRAARLLITRCRARILNGMGALRPVACAIRMPMQSGALWPSISYGL